MLRSTVTPTAALAALATLAAGCVERVIHERVCADGRLSPGEVCLGEGERSTVTVDTLAPLALRVADFDGDGPPDLVVLGTDAEGKVASLLWPGDGDGGFARPLDPGLYGCSAHPVPGTIDDDEFADLLVAECGPTMAMFRGTASGVFQRVGVDTGITTLSSAMLDLDGDARREVAVLGLDAVGQAAVSVAERHDVGGFAPPVVSALVGPPGFAPGGFSVLDFDGDAGLDLLLVHPGVPDGLAVARGDAALGFDPPMLVPAPLVPDGATVRDLDGDGRDEVLVVSFSEEVYAVLDVRGAGGGATLVERARTEIPGLRPGPAALADLDGDGRQDLLRVEPEAARLEARLGRRDGGFGEPTEIDLDTPADQIAVADLDQDGALDVVVGSFDAARIHVLLTSP